MVTILHGLLRLCGFLYTWLYLGPFPEGLGPYPEGLGVTLGTFRYIGVNLRTFLGYSGLIWLGLWVIWVIYGWVPNLLGLYGYIFTWGTLTTFNIQGLAILGYRDDSPPP